MPEQGLRFDAAKVLLDPYGRGVVVPKGYSREAAGSPGDNAATAMKSVVIDPGLYDWEGDQPLHRPASQTIVYEMHVRGFTRHPSSGLSESARGTYAGLIEKIPYLQQQRHADVHRFVSLLCARRGLRDIEHERQRISVNTMLRDAKKAWHGIRLNQPDWGDASHCIAFGGELRREGLLFHFILNAYWEPLEFELPTLNGGPWRRWIDTALDSPDDIVPWEQAPEVSGNSYPVLDRSVVMLYARNK